LLRSQLACAPTWRHSLERGGQGSPSCFASCDTQQLSGLLLARHPAQFGVGEQNTNIENRMNIDGGQRLEREDGSLWDKLEIGRNLLLIFLSDDAT
jgi:hypothetical protein